MRWSERFAFREKVHERYPEVWDLKLVRKRLPYISSCIRDGESVLEIGASNNRLETRLKAFHPRLRYKSMDVDPRILMTTHPSRKSRRPLMWCSCLR